MEGKRLKYSEGNCMRVFFVAGKLEYLSQYDRCFVVKVHALYGWITLLV